MIDQYNLTIVSPDGGTKTVAFGVSRKLSVGYVRGAKYILMDAYSGDLIKEVSFRRKGDALEVHLDIKGDGVPVVELIDFFYAGGQAEEGLDAVESEGVFDFNGGVHNLAELGFPMESSGAVVGALSLSTPLIGALGVGAGVVALAPTKSSDANPPVGRISSPLVLTSYADNEGEIRSLVSVEYNTDDSTPGFNIGIVPAGVTPNLYINNVRVRAGYDSISGTLTPETALPDGVQSVRYSLTDTSRLS